MYSTNLTVGKDWMSASLFDQDNACAGYAYGWESNNMHSSPTQTAKDNALLWSLAPEMVEVLQRFVHGPSNISDHYHACAELLDKLAHAIPPASVAAYVPDDAEMEANYRAEDLNYGRDSVAADG